ncbi:GSCOCT00014239001.2-RA-CDS [Cotesia congregata]|uniref:Uncharacterized protein n=1 Tax=Cotesia congregata TaxID=51543 RepID=S6CVL0_COTCN|nr:GSCOCT00014239001.2-RA-CDS [Cotesia congregata]CCQ71089.1 hypothetical protein BV3-1 [Cotesia congregata]
MNTPLVAFVVILGITWAEALPKRIDIVIGSRNTQSNNTFEMGHVPNNKTTNSSQITYGSVTNQHDERFFILGRANKTEVLARWHKEEQENLNFLTKSCRELKGELNQAFQRGQNKQTIINLFYHIIEIELDLQNQQESLDQFNYKLPWTQSKRDDFDNNLCTILLQIENLTQRSLLIIRPKN